MTEVLSNSTAAQAATMAEGESGNVMPMPKAGEVVTKEILRVVGLNAQAFSGSANPSSIYTMMVQGSPSIFPYYREVEEKDTAIASALETRRILALARESKVQSADPGSGEAQRYAQGLSEFLESIPKFREALAELLDAPGYGYSVLEILWDPEPSGVWCDGLVGRPPELFSFGNWTDPQTGELRLSTFPGGQGVPVPPNKFLVNSYRVRNGDRRGQPLLRRLFWPSWFKRKVLRLHLHYLEKGPGTVAVKYNAAAGEEEKQLALQAAQGIAEEIAVGVPEGFTVIPELLTQSRTRDGNDFRALFDYLDAEMTRMILGQTLSTRGSEQGVGTRALGDVHQQTLFEYTRNDLAAVEDVINEQLARPWLGWTFGPRALERDVRPYWRTDKEPPADVDATLDRLGKARQMGAKIPSLEVYEKAQIRQPEGDEPTLPLPTLPMDLFTPGA